MVYNKVYAQIGEERHIVLDPINYQYDIKQILVITGETVPDYYEADVCNVGDTATLTMVGTAADGVEIPDKFLLDGRNVLVYVVIPGSGGDVQTRYDITIPVDERAEREDIDPSEAEQQQIDSLVAALNSGVGRAETAATEAEGSASNAAGHATDAEAWAVGKRAGEDVPDTDPTYQNNAKYYAGAAEAAAEEAGRHEASWESWVRHAEAAADDAEGSARAAAGSKADAEAAAKTATQQATAAGNSATAAAGSATEARQTVDGGVGAINTARNGALSAIEQAGTTQVNAVNQAGAAQVTAVNQAGTTQTQAVEDKGEEVLNSIPQDYSDLVDDVTDLTRQLSDVEENQIPELKSAIAKYAENAANLQIPFTSVTTFVQGDINNAGVVDPSVKYRACTNGIITLPEEMDIMIESGYRIYVRLYTSEGVYIRGTGWLVDRVTLSGKVAITIGKTPESTEAVYDPLSLESGLSYKSYTGDFVSQAELELSYAIANTDNILRFLRITKDVNGVTVNAFPYDRMTLVGTGTANGGRKYHLSDMTLPAGSYYILTVPDTPGDACEVMVQKASDDTQIISGSGRFTLSTETAIYFSVNVLKDKVYNVSQRVILVQGTEKPDYIPPITAVDYVVRKQVDDALSVTSAPYNRDNPLSVASKENTTWSQGACCVGDKVVGFSAGADDHSTTGKVKISNVFDLVNVTTVTHNLGHACSADYNAITDTMMIGNGSTDAANLPAMYLVKNAAAWANSPSNLTYNGENVMAIDLSTIGGYEMVCCFGENETVAYVMTIDTENVITIFKCLLGLGANNLVSTYPSNSFGTFVSGCDDDEYNGTLHVLSSYSGGTDVTGEIQGLKYINGRIIMPTDKYYQKQLHAFISVLALDDSTNTIRIEKNLWIPMVGSDGAPIRTECEDVCFYRGCGYVVTISTINGVRYPRTSEFTLALY